MCHITEWFKVFMYKSRIDAVILLNTVVVSWKMVLLCQLLFGSFKNVLILIVSRHDRTILAKAVF